MNNNQDNPVADKVGRGPFNEISVLFPLLSLYTAAYLALTAGDFFLKTALKLPDGIMPLYIALLGAYATDKEIRKISPLRLRREYFLTKPPRHKDEWK